MEKKYQVFVSSTYSDLIEERRAVIDVILGMEQFPVGMEMFSAANDDQWSIIQNTIDNSDYYVLIIGQRYGSVINEGPSKGISYTEREFDYAIEKGVPVLTFIIDEKVPVVPKNVESDPVLKNALNNFKSKASSHHYVKWWKDKGDLTTQVVIALNKAMNDAQHPRPGWVRSNAAFSKDNNELAGLKDRLGVLENAQTWHSFERKTPFDRISAVQNNDAANVLITYAAQCDGKFKVKENIIRDNPFIEVGSFELPADDNARDSATWVDAIKVLEASGYVEITTYGLNSQNAYKLSKLGWDYVEEYGKGSFTKVDDPNKMFAELESYNK